MSDEEDVKGVKDKIVLNGLELNDANKKCDINKSNEKSEKDTKKDLVSLKEIVGFLSSLSNYSFVNR
ncbi:unnamed protein product [Toxocara canis]|uniref:Uncharacterized protein n=1 Tax=Toxocara canis TaxID=6265 RepID=A0A183V5F2_TOXCA|nr:unnamed protein product [Toxocara canis]